MSARQTPAATPGGKPVEFFTLGCQYSIAPGATLPDLLGDGHALLRSALGVLSNMDIGDDALFAVLHLLRQSEAVIGAADELAHTLAAGTTLDANGGAA